MRENICRDTLKGLRAKLVTQNAFPGDGHFCVRYDPIGGYARQFDSLDIVLESSWRDAAHARHGVDPFHFMLFDRIQPDEASLVSIHRRCAITSA
jgi:hypothetical protein